MSKIKFDTISNGDDFFMIEGGFIRFWGLHIETKKIKLTPKALEIIAENDIPMHEVCEFNEDCDFALFSLLY